jgi:hypothetical protein
MIKLVNIELTEKEVEQFLILKAHNVFGLRNGSATLNFDSEGTLTEINCAVKIYKKGFPQRMSLQGLD